MRSLVIHERVTGIAFLMLLVCAGLIGGCAWGPFGPGIDTRLQHAAKITVKVVDDSGNPIPKAQVTISTYGHWVGGDNFGTTVDKESHGVTDKNGLCSLALFGKTGEYGCYVKTPAGYYGGESTNITFTNSALGRWLPWNPTLKIEAWKIGIQVPVYASRIFLKKVPDETKPMGFDLMVADWVEPYGMGKISDFIFHFEIAPTTWITNSYGKHIVNDWKRILTFSNDGDGIQTFKELKCGLMSPREAPIDGYEPSLIQHEYDEPFQRTEKRAGRQFQETYTRFHQGFLPDRNYFFRVRTKKDDQGNIVSALYGKIYSDFNSGMSGVHYRKQINFTYYLNPKPNSRNMEFNPNLFIEESLSEMHKINMIIGLRGILTPEEQKERGRFQDLPMLESLPP